MTQDSNLEPQTSKEHYDAVNQLAKTLCDLLEPATNFSPLDDYISTSDILRNIDEWQLYLSLKNYLKNC